MEDGIKSYKVIKRGIQRAEHGAERKNDVKTQREREREEREQSLSK